MTAKAPAAKKPAKAKAPAKAKRASKAKAETQTSKPSDAQANAAARSLGGSPGAKPPEAKAPAAKKPANGRREERLPIETITARGDWVDPFSGLTVAYGNEVNPTNFARREGDEAVMWVTD